MSFTAYDMRQDEMARIADVAAFPWPGKCSCGIQDNKPSHCKQGPIVQSHMPGCGYYFCHDEKGEIIRQGRCLRCGACCAQPRKDADPYGRYDPNGSRCRHLIVEEE